MHILVPISPAPEAEAPITLQDGIPTWKGAPLGISPLDGYALEAALRLKDAHNAQITVLSVSGPTAQDALKQSLALGADSAILLNQTAPDSLSLARLLAAAAQKLTVDLVIFGRLSLHYGSGITPAQTARALAWPLLSLVGQMSLQDGQITVQRSFEEARETVRASLPAVLTITQAIGDLRYPSFLGIRKAAKANIPTWSLADLAQPAPVPTVRSVKIFAPAQHACEFIQGATPAETAQKLADKILAEKVL